METVLTIYRMSPTLQATDGCGLPAPTIPLLQLGLATARFAKPVDLSDSRAQAIYRLQEAITN